MAMGVVDIAMMGRVSAEALAAVALGHLYSFATLVFGLGCLQALDPLVSQAVGAKDHGTIGSSVQRGLVVAVFLGVLTCLFLVPAAWVFTLLEQPEDVIPDATVYVHATIPGAIPFLIFVVFRQTLQSLSRTAPIVTAILIANAANVVLNWALIFGNLGMPALGAEGCAWATTACRFLLAALLAVLGWRELRSLLVPVRREAFDARGLLNMLRLGVPIGVAHSIEYGAFMVTALFMGHLGTLQLAGHQVAMNLAALSFMFPLGISAAAAVRVGYAVGRADPPGTTRAAATSLIGGATVMTVFAAVFLTLPLTLAGLYTDEIDVAAMAAALIPLAGVFQVFDGVQVVAGGVLRGLGDTRTPMLVHLFGFWAMGIPLGRYLAFGANLGPEGLWWGLVAGLAAVSVVLLLRVRTHLRRGVTRIETG